MKTIYLCGPINGRTDADCTTWRESAKKAWPGETIDPMRNDYRGREGMMKLRGGNNIMLGLSRENVKRLMAGQPILFDGAEINLPGLTFSIMFGETEFSMEQALIDAGWKIPQ